MAFDLTALSAYTQENTDLIAEAILKTEVLSNIAVRTGVSAGTTTLNIFSADFADAARACGWDASGDFVYDQIAVTVEDRQIKQEVCPTDLRSYWLSERMQPGEAGNEEVPFAELVSSYFLSGIQKNLEDFIGAQLLAQITTGNGAQLQGGTPAALDPSNALEQLNDLYDALDERAKMMDDVIIVMSPANYRVAVRAMVAANYFSYNVGDGQGAIMLPGTNATLVKSSGFAGEDTIVALPSKYAVFATGLMDDADKFNMFYDAGVDTVKVTAYYRRGLGVYSVDQCATNGL